MRRIALLVLVFLPLWSSAGDFGKDFVVVFATAGTETKFGKLPLDRALIAQAIENAARDEAKGVIVKFFLDQARDADSDARLARSMSLIPVIPQARLDDSEQRPNPLPQRFTLAGAGYATSVQGNSGWIPLPVFADKSRDVCFADFSSSPVPMLETYQGRMVKSLLLCSVELAVGQQASLRAGSEVRIAALSVPLDEQNRASVKFPASASLETVDFADLVAGKLPKGALKGRVVLLGYDGPGIHSVPTPVGNIGAHRAFTLLLKAFYELTP